MTDQELQEYYSGLLIIQYANLPKAKATIEAMVDPVIMNQLPTNVMNAFNLETAVGVQLDTLGKYIGVSRRGAVSGNIITLDDADYLTLLNIVIIKNNFGTSLYDIQTLLNAVLPGQIFVSDSRNMNISYVLIETLGSSDLLQLIKQGDYLPRPMGVATSITIVPSHENPFFGFRTYDAADPTVAPFNNYDLYQLTYPWLNYDD